MPAPNNVHAAMGIVLLMELTIVWVDDMGVGIELVVLLLIMSSQYLHDMLSMS